MSAFGLDATFLDPSRSHRSLPLADVSRNRSDSSRSVCVRLPVAPGCWCRIPPILASFSSWNRPAGSGRYETVILNLPTFWIFAPSCPPGVNEVCSAWRLRRTTRHRVGFSSTLRTATAIPSLPASDDPEIRSWPMPPAGSTCDGAAHGNPSSANRSRITMAATSRSVPTATCISASVTEGAPTIRRIARRIRTCCSEKCCASTSTYPTAIRPVTPFPRTIRFCAANRWRRCQRSGASGCAIRGGTASTIRLAAAAAHSSSRMSVRTSGKRSTTSRAIEAPATTAGEIGRGRIPTSDRRRRPYQPLVDPIHEYSHSQGQSITGGFIYRGRLLGSTFVGRYFFADFITGRVWSLALNVNASSGEATVAQVTEHTASLGGASQLGRVSSFGIDMDGELYIVSHDQGRILKLIAPPPTPASLRIIR